jgi:hypothetical protein
MLHGIRIYTGDRLWRKILGDLGAVMAENAKGADLDFDSLALPGQVSGLELKSIILDAIEKRQQKIIRRIFGHFVALPRLQQQIVVLLFQTGGMAADDLKAVLGYSPDIATHTVDTAIYQLRKAYGRDFIKNENRKYSLGKL